MVDEKKLVLVTGVTGQQGGAVARSLLKRGFGVRGMARSSSSDAAQELASIGVELVQAEFTDAASLEAAARGVDAVFAMTTPFEAGVEAETAQGVAMVDAATSAGVDHFVYSSVASADQETGIPHFDSKYRVEQHLAASDLRWSVIGPAYFMDNLFLPMMREGLEQGAYAIALPPDLPLQQVAVDDIGKFVAHVLADPVDFAGRRIDVAGDELTASATADVLSEVLARPISAVQVPIEQIRAFSEDLAIMYEWFIAAGYSVDIEALRAEFPEVRWHRFADWIRGASSRLA